MKLDKNFISLRSYLVNENLYYWVPLVLVIASVCAFIWYQGNFNSGVYYLANSRDADWILDNTPFDVNARPFKQEVKLFKKKFVITSVGEKTTLHVKAFKFFRVFIDDALIYESGTDASKWKELHAVDINELGAGEHELVILVMNYDGPVAVYAYAESVSLKTDTTWLVGVDGKNWAAAKLANEPKTPAVSTKFPPAYMGLIETIPIGVIAFIFVFGLSRYDIGKKLQFNSAKLRWILLGCWIILTINSLAVTKLMGFDMIYHAEYIQFILTNKRLPLATDGLQMFQSPLFYIVSAIFVKLFSAIVDIKTSFHLLKIIPLLCGIATVEICYRCARLVFPERDDLQSIALLVGTMMPMNLYMSQYLSNEPLLGVLSALCVLMMLTWIRTPQYTLQIKQQILLGLLLGLALLAKATAFLLVIIALTGMMVILLQMKAPKKALILSIMRVLIVLSLIAGWYYLRNWISLGKPFVGGWDTGRGLTWWQEPGYRSFNNFITFGQALVYPIYAASHSFWDAFYSTLWADGLLGSQSTFETRPPWNYNFIFATLWLSLLPSAGILIALLGPIKCKYFDMKTAYMALFCNCSIIIYLLAIIYLYINLPIYSTVKASYSLGLLPCYALLTAYGFARIMKNNISKLVVTSFILWWSVCAYLSYFSTGSAV